MSEIVSFPRPQESVHKSFGATPCNPPIGVRKVQSTAMLIDFRTDCFSVPHLELALRYASSPGWFYNAVYAGQNGYLDNKHYTCYVAVLLDLSVKRDVRKKALKQVLYLITQSVYQEECRVKMARVHDVRELAKPRQPNLAEGLFVSGQTVRQLREANIRTIQDLTTHTREEICAVPGMTTGELYRLECALASRGHYLHVSEL